MFVSEYETVLAAPESRTCYLSFEGLNESTKLRPDNVGVVRTD